ncbi:hypothetical protein FRE64_01840 [Euhalothece natronophila Z-M001]|uniref:DUF1795 domain-containing protein n=1 Tax=Euhalothece natronophila Z-M001 TaxID=522448 RepID=A0A5B8NKA1_9CHRO|nr:hypothetical protein [Euhalothece natronophila]QDZ38790.1 hypothetical protein FRE64_01840 [Euhalothece natronophila Z-M001]
MKHLISFFLVLVLITLSSCQQIASEDNPTAMTVSEADASLEAYDLTTEDWEMLEGESVKLSVPASYRGGSPNLDLTEIESTLEQLNGDYSERLQAVQENPEEIALIAFDTQFFESDTLTNVNVVQHELDEEISLEDYLSQAVSNLEATHNIEEQEIINNNDTSMGRILTTLTTEEGVEMTQLFYIHSQPEAMWITTYTTPSSEFEQRVSNFEESIASLEIEALE